MNCKLCIRENVTLIVEFGTLIESKNSFWRNYQWRKQWIILLPAQKTSLRRLISWFVVKPFISFGMLFWCLLVNCCSPWKRTNCLPLTHELRYFHLLVSLRRILNNLNVLFFIWVQFPLISKNNKKRIWRGNHNERNQNLKIKKKTNYSLAAMVLHRYHWWRSVQRNGLCPMLVHISNLCQSNKIQNCSAIEWKNWKIDL